LGIIDDLEYFQKFIQCQVNYKNVVSLITIIDIANIILGYFSELRKLTLFDIIRNEQLPRINNLLSLQHISLETRDDFDGSLNLNQILTNGWLPSSVNSLEFNSFHHPLDWFKSSDNNTSTRIHTLIIYNCSWHTLLQLFLSMPHLHIVRIHSAHQRVIHEPIHAEDKVPDRLYLTNLHTFEFDWKNVDIDLVNKLLECMPKLVQCYLRGKYTYFLPQKLMRLARWEDLTRHCRKDILQILCIEMEMPAGENTVDSLLDLDADRYLNRIEFHYEVDRNIENNVRIIKGTWRRQH
jgi:hypothetical protein